MCQRVRVSIRVVSGRDAHRVNAGPNARFELEFARGHAGAGTYAFVTHAFADATRGTVGIIQVREAKALAARGN